jgi:hypothetical protein
MDAVSRKFLKPLLSVEPSRICEGLKTDGMGLYGVLKLLSEHTIGGAAVFAAHALGLILNDFSIKDPRPTPQNPKPKKTPSLFSDEEGNIVGDVPPFRGRRWSRKQQQPTPGSPRFKNTKALFPYVCETVIEHKKPEHFSIFSEPLLQFLSLPPDELKSLIGDTNENHWADYLVSALLSFADFGSDAKPLDWAKTAAPPFVAVFRLLSCDIFAEITLGLLLQRLTATASVGPRVAIISGLVSAVSSLSSIAFTLRTRINAIAWSLDPNFVSFTLPAFALDFIAVLAQDPKLHVDVRRTVVSAIVAYFKNLFARGAPPQYADVLFGALEAQFTPAKTALGPTFCQLLRPKFCRLLAHRDAVARDLMPTTPVSLLAPQRFGELAMPRRGDWQPLYERYVETFIGPSLLAKDEHLLQLVVQVLTKIGVRGGRVSEQVSRFLAKAFTDFIPEDVSEILIGFQFKFCFVEPHQVYTDMIDAFIAIFQKARRSLDALISAQLKLMWTNDATFDRAVFEPVRRVFDVFRSALDDVILKKKEKEDIAIVSLLSKRVLPALDLDRPPALQFPPFDALRARVDLLTSAPLAAALAADPGEDAMSHVVDFLLRASPDIFRIGVPPYVDVVFRKNDKHLTPALIRRLADMPESLAWLPALHGLLRGPIQNALDAHKGDADELLPLLWKFASVDEFAGRRAAILHKAILSPSNAPGARPAPEQAAFRFAQAQAFGRPPVPAAVRVAARAPAPMAPARARAPMEPPTGRSRRSPVEADSPVEPPQMRRRPSPVEAEAPDSSETGYYSEDDGGGGSDLETEAEAESPMFMMAEGAAAEEAPDAIDALEAGSDSSEAGYSEDDGGGGSDSEPDDGDD